MHIFYKIKDSIYNPEYYKSIPVEETLGQAIKYLAKLALIISLITIIILGFFIPKFQGKIKELTNTFIENYPSDLIVSFKNGNASINQPEPYKIAVGKIFLDPSIDTEILEQNKSMQNMLVIDTKTPFSIEKFKEYSTFSWLTKTDLITLKTTNGQMQINPISTIGNIEISKTWLLEKQDYLFNKLPIIIPILLILAYLILFIVNFSGTLFALILYAFVVWLISKIAKHELTYKQCYILGIHAVTLILVTDAIAMPLGLPTNIFIKLVMLVVVIYLNFFKSSKEETMISSSSNL